MNQGGSRERRYGRRYVLHLSFKGTQLSFVGVSRRPRGIVRGKVQNIGAGGLCLLASHGLAESQLVRGELILPDIPVGIPTLMQVRWIRRATEGPRYITGLQFLI